MLRQVRIAAMGAVTLCPSAVLANASCNALGQLLLAADLMQVAAETGDDLEATYGSTIRGALSALNSSLPDLAASEPGHAVELEGLGAQAQAALGSDEMRDTARALGRQAQGLYASWRCEDAPTDGEDAEGEGGIGTGEGDRSLDTDGMAGLRGTLIRFSRENRIERAAFLGTSTTLAILMPYLLMREIRRKRRTRRYVYLAPTMITAGFRRVEAQFFDISTTGAKLLTPGALHKKTPIRVELSGKPHAASVVRSGQDYAWVAFTEPLSEADLQALLEARRAEAAQSE